MLISCVFTDEDCKEKWINLRDYYRRKKDENPKVVSGKSGDAGGRKGRKWAFFDQMDFLRPYMQKKG